MRKLLALLISVMVLTVACQDQGKEPQQSEQAELTLKDAYRDHFVVGAALNKGVVMGEDKQAADILVKHFNTITPENMMKWERIHPKPGVYNFDPVDKYVELGEKNNMHIVAHVLMWHSQTPNWVFEDSEGNPVSRDTLLFRLKDHIHTIMGRYKGRIHCWDVVNESIADDGTIRKTKWYEIIGEDFMEKAFEYAHEADPDALLIYNDYSLPNKVKRDKVVEEIKKLIDKGIKVDGIGMQGHYNLDFPKLEDLEASILAFSDLGVQVMITELDLNVLPWPGKNQGGADISLNFELKKELDPFYEGFPDSMQVKFTNRYAELMGLFIKHSDKINRVTWWGIHDGASWLNGWPVKGRTNYPMLFDREYKAKPALDAIIKLTEKK